jgi:RNA polymerase sigma-70 factor (ECF subfamily)
VSLDAVNGNARASPGEQAAWLERVGRHADTGAFECLFNHFYPLLCRYMQRCGVSQGEVEELVQDTMVKVWLKAKHYRPALAAPSTWVFTIARNLRTDRIRKSGVAKGYFVFPESVEVGQCGGEESRADALAILDRLEELSHDQVAVLKLVYLEGLSQTEISEQLNLPLGTVKSRIRLAVRTMRRKLRLDS